jgi:MFS family permease
VSLENSPEPASTTRGLRALWAATAVTSLGDGAYLAAAPLLATTITGDPLTVSVVTTATLTPWFLVGPFAGALVDRWPRLTVMVLADLVRAVSVLALTLLILGDFATIPALAITGFILTSSQSFHGAAAQAIIPSLTGRDRTALATTNSRIATTESVVGGFVGPPVGSALFSISPWIPIVADAASFAASAALLRAVPTPVRHQHDGEGIFASLAQAIRWMFIHRQLLELALLVAGGNLATNVAMATFVLYAHQNLGVTWGFGLLLAVQAVGATIGGGLATQMSGRLTFRTMLSIAQVSRAMAFLILALTGSPYLAAVCMAIIGASFTIGTVAAVSARQQLVPGHMLGRVVNVFRLIGNGAAPVGAAIGGIMAANFALNTPILFGALFTFAVAGLSLLQPQPPARGEPATQPLSPR